VTGKADMGSVLDLPSHLSQPSQSENVPIFDSGTRCYFVPKNHAFGANPGKEKGNSQPRRTSRPLPTVLPPVGRCVASWGGGGVRIPPQPIWARGGELFGAPKAKQEKGAASWTPPPRSLLPTVRAVAPFHQRRRRRGFSAGGGVENRNDPAITGKAAGSWR
jgi:hypothetical protein